MTDGHKHRYLHVGVNSTLLHLLRTPLVHSADREAVEKSKWVWGADRSDIISGDGPVRYVTTYRLTVLGILHTLTGLTVCTDDPKVPHSHG